VALWSDTLLITADDTTRLFPVWLYRHQRQKRILTETVENKPRRWSLVYLRLMRSRWILTSLLAVLALSVFSNSATAATIQTDKACYPAVGSVGADMNISGQGFAPGELVSAEVPDKAGLMGFVDGTVAADGSLSLALDSIYPPGIDPVAYPETLQIKDVLSGAILASTSFYLTNLTVTSKVRHGKAKLQLAGFTPGRQIFAHYLAGRKKITDKLGKASGPCGLLKTSSQLPSIGDSFIAQFDSSRKYIKKTAPQVRLKFFRY